MDNNLLLSPALSKRFLDMAARAAIRGMGDVEPNPLVGAVIVRSERDGTAPRIIGMGHHRKFGGPHAEVDAINDCRLRGEDPSGATMYVTLEPCNHTGKTGPCTKSVLTAGISRLVMARRDPNPIGGGGAEVLRKAGVQVTLSQASTLATRISDPFVKRITTGLPWVIAKWAQTIDGRVATRDGDSKWISCETSRRRVHRMRSRVDAILTGEGTIVADNPMLTARGVPRLRRLARRIVISRSLDLVFDFQIITTAKQAPVTFFCSNAAYRSNQHFREYLQGRGAEVVPLPGVDGTTDLDLRAALKYLVEKHGISTVLVESGPRLMRRLFKQDLVDEVHVYVAPKILGDAEAHSAVDGFAVRQISATRKLSMLAMRRSGEDALLMYGRGVMQ
ncbi:MAG: bifunctional diaminohydroxyphosphoribosylaminopyrimidine deaminase/5-amino-6-(5-phosphoribosylamino)uracil reductase RibD [Pyrinomonadaceae bacterium]|nr:bifunctional diaminohydroxyphosphoribosylaminopyrimidine deaminase/5-amino-6-(5-phosphoribosylamino)uracil reductase RibD [Phycisphaerales bacterium]